MCLLVLFGGGRLNSSRRLRGFHGLDHAILHEATSKGPMHAFQADDLADDLDPDAGVELEDDNPRVHDANPDAVSPAINGILRPVLRDDALQAAHLPHDPRVLLLRDEERMAPLLVQVIQLRQLALRKRRRILPLAPGRHGHGPAGLEHPRHLLHVLFLIRHVFPALARPHEVELGVAKLHRERVHDLEPHVPQAALLGELGAADDLALGEGDADDLGGREGGGEVAGGAAEAAADVEDAEGFTCGGRGLGERGDLGPVEHFPDKVELRGLEVCLECALRDLLVGVVAEMDVVAPVVLEDPLVGPRVVLCADAVEGARVRAGGGRERLFEHEGGEDEGDDGEDRGGQREGREGGGEGGGGGGECVGAGDDV
mmetsp:Transcript_1816/g.4893  ORF Transcript_1816/g.4893 Transcript_1816/m.4893 type:complete len:371 (+) Transcript_1816:473-1585(+)